MRSALSQIVHDIEVVVVHDDSSDDTTGLWLMAEDTRLQYIRKPNGGPARALHPLLPCWAQMKMTSGTSRANTLVAEPGT